MLHHNDGAKMRQLLPGSNRVGVLPEVLCWRMLVRLAWHSSLLRPLQAAA